MIDNEWEVVERHRRHAYRAGWVAGFGQAALAVITAAVIAYILLPSREPQQLIKEVRK